MRRTYHLGDFGYDCSPTFSYKHVSRHTKDLSLVMFILLSVGLSLWLVYGIALRSVPVIIANSVTLLLALYLIYLKVKHG